MKFDIITIFPEFFTTPLSCGLMKKALSCGLLEVHAHDLRSWSENKHRKVDDVPFGGSTGMLLQGPPIVRGLASIQELKKKSLKIYLSPQGKVLHQTSLKRYLEYEQIILLCGRYEGVDARIVENYIDEELSIGDYVLNGGEAAALVFIEAVARLIPGFLGESDSLKEESFTPYLEYPQYTRPFEFGGHEVPEILLSGNRAEIQKWREKESFKKTLSIRPDLLMKKNNKTDFFENFIFGEPLFSGIRHLLFGDEKQIMGASPQKYFFTI